MKFIIGKKLDMTQVWHEEVVIPVTRVQAGPCTVVQIKTEDKDGYQAVQLGYGERKKKNIKKPQQKHMGDLGNFQYLREFRLAPSSPKDAKGRQDDAIKRGDRIDVSTFEAGDKVKATGISKGKGFQGVVKRHKFSGAPKSHGTKDQLRMPGSIGATGPAHVFKGQRMPGRMGGDQVTVSNLEIIEVDKENDVLLIRGAVPGARNGLLLIQGEGQLKTIQIATNEEQITTNNEAPSTPDNTKVTLKTPNKEKIEKQKEENIEEVVVEAAKKGSLNVRKSAENAEVKKG